MSIFPSSSSGSDTDARRLVERAAKGAHEMVDRTTERVLPAADRVQDGIDQATAMVNERAEQFGELQEYWLKNSRASIRARPLTAIAAAVVFGLLLGKITGR